MRSLGSTSDGETVIRSAELDFFERKRAVKLIKWLCKNRETAGVVEADILIR